MTILPKKNNTRKNEQDDDNDNRNRQRNRNNRNNRHPSHPSHHTRDDFDYDELGTGIDNSVVPSSPMYGDIENRDAHEGLPHKRSRHIQGSPYYLASSSPPSNSRVTSREESPIGEGETEDGYNSSDEHGPPPTGGIEERAVPKSEEGSEDTTQQEADFEGELREKKGFTIKQMATDGACMFRAVADQVYGDQEMHTVVRRHCMDYMVQNIDFFSQYITEDFASYIRRKRREHSHGNHIEMQALSEMYNRPIEVYQYSIVPINTFNSRSHNSDDNPPMRLSYHGSVHYNSIVDPYNPTVGVGLGLAGYKPGLEDQGVLNKATQESEALILEQAMLEDKIKATDWEATDEQLAELATRESYLQWLRDNQRSTNSAGASSSTSTSTQSKRMSPAHEGSNLRRSPPHVASTSRRSPPRETKRSPPRENHVRTMGGSSPINKFPKAESSSSCPSLSTERKSPERDLRPSSSHWNYDFDYDTNWDNDPVLAAVLAQSQQEYLEWYSRPSNSSADNNNISNNNDSNNDDSGANTSGSSENTDDGGADSNEPATNNNSNM